LSGIVCLSQRAWKYRFVLSRKLSGFFDTFLDQAKKVVKTKKSILDFFNNRSTNVAAISFNAKMKSFKAFSRGVRDVNFSCTDLLKFMINEYNPQTFVLMLNKD